MIRTPEQQLHYDLGRADMMLTLIKDESLPLGLCTTLFLRAQQLLSEVRRAAGGSTDVNVQLDSKRANSSPASPSRLPPYPVQEVKP